MKNPVIALADLRGALDRALNYAIPNALLSPRPCACEHDEEEHDGTHCTREFCDCRAGEKASPDYREGVQDFAARMRKLLAEHPAA